MNRRPAIVAIVVTVVASLYANQTRAKDFRCFDTKHNGSYDCEDVGCKIKKVKPNQGFCATAKDFVARDLKPNEQMCCTQTEAVVRVVEPGDQLVCNRVEATIFHRNTPEVRQDIAACMEGKEDPAQCAPQACCEINSCGYDLVDLFKGEHVACTATSRLKFTGIAGPWQLACTNGICWQAALVQGEKFACKRFDNLPTAGNELRKPEGNTEAINTGTARGPDSAPITIIEFSDFQCPYCVRAEETVKALLEAEEYRGKIKLVYRDYPLPSHGLAPKAAEAAHCAADQGKYWEMHDKLFGASPQLEVADLKA